ncbi:MAG: tripartite tricarboxylate transporter permease [Thermodesulfobacteriota bacterium]|nr:tripartite tricarboxylate transporter permease [Thermodesulfobacteriota bacterium]
MESFELLIRGFGVALTPINILYAFTGCFVGTVIGVLPGLGPLVTIAMILPTTFGMNPTSAMIMMAAVYYGAQYGGSTTSILLNIPGESASVITCLDGYQMARKGRAGAALAMAAISSYIAGTLSVVGLMLLAPPLADIALSFGPPEYFSLILMGLSTIVFLGGRSVVKSMISIVLGLMIGLVGVDPVGGVNRFTFGSLELIDGVSFIVVVMGVFGIGEVLVSAEERMKISIIKTKLSEFMPTPKEWKESAAPIARGSVIGFLVGVLPGTGATIASFLSYATEKMLSKNPEKFGKGAIEGVAGPEGANNAAVCGAMVPLFTLGVPGSGTTAVMMGAMVMYGLRPGPMLFQQNPDFIWGIIASMYLGNFILLIMNLPLVPLFASLLRVPYSILYPFILLVCVTGTYSLENSLFHVGLLFIFGIVGYFVKKFELPGAPIVLALVLGPMVERALYQSLTLSHGRLSILVTRPYSLAFLIIILLVLMVPIVRWIRKRRRV